MHTVLRVNGTFDRVETNYGSFLLCRGQSHFLSRFVLVKTNSNLVRFNMFLRPNINHFPATTFFKFAFSSRQIQIPTPSTVSVHNTHHLLILGLVFCPRCLLLPFTHARRDLKHFSYCYLSTNEGGLAYLSL